MKPEHPLEVSPQVAQDAENRASRARALAVLLLASAAAAYAVCYAAARATVD